MEIVDHEGMVMTMSVGFHVKGLTRGQRVRKIMNQMGAVILSQRKPKAWPA